MKSYWSRDPFLHCQVIFQLFSRNCFIALNQHLHLTNPATICMDKNSPNYDKMDKVRWLLTCIQEAYQKQWNVRQEITIDKMMVQNILLSCTPIYAKKTAKMGTKDLMPYRLGLCQILMYIVVLATLH